MTNVVLKGVTGMKREITIADSELPIMKILWERGALTSPEIFEHLEGNKSTLKTLLKRLVEKGAVETERINARTYRYFPVLTQDEYVDRERRGFLQRVFDGSKRQMLLNFVREEKITREDLEELFRLIEEE